MPPTRHAAIDNTTGRVGFLLRKWTAAVRMLPGFIIIGAQKCGTTTLYEYLNQHPAVARALTQEVHFFDLNYRQGQSWYRAHFATKIAREIVRRRSGMELITGEASAYYLFHPLVCRRVRQALPDARLIVVLRDPVERAWAHYLDSRKIGFEPLTFEEALDQEEQRLAGERMRLLHGEGATSFAHREYSYLSRGVYVDQLRQWMEVFPRDQMHIVNSEELLFRSPLPVIAEVQRHLGLRPLPPARLKNYSRLSMTDINETTRSRLLDYFRPHNQRLFEYLGTKFDWES